MRYYAMDQQANLALESMYEVNVGRGTPISMPVVRTSASGADAEEAG